jgi:antitoxin VapB
MNRPQIAKLFRIGRSQSVRLPAKYRFSGDEVFITREGDRVILSAKPDSWDDFFVTSHRVPTNFLSPRKAALPQKRKLFK